MIHEDLIIVTHEDLLPPLVELDFPAELDEAVTFRVPNQHLTLRGIVKEIDLEDRTLKVQYTRPCGVMESWISVGDLVTGDEVELCPDCGKPLNVGTHQIRVGVAMFVCEPDEDYDDQTARIVLAVQAGRRLR